MNFEMIYKNSNNYNFTASEKKILDFIYLNISIIDNFSITNIAKLTFSSSSSVNRLVNKIGISYSDFKFLLHNFKNSYKSNEPTTLITNDTIAACHQIIKSSHVFIVAVGPNKYSASYLNEMLYHFNIHSTLLLDHHTISSLTNIIKKNDMVIYISCSGNTSTIFEVANTINKKNIPTLLITLNKTSNIKQLTTHNLIKQHDTITINNKKHYLHSKQIESVDEILKTLDNIIYKKTIT